MILFDSDPTENRDAAAEQCDSRVTGASDDAHSSTTVALIGTAKFSSVSLRRIINVLAYCSPVGGICETRHGVFHAQSPKRRKRSPGEHVDTHRVASPPRAAHTDSYDVDPHHLAAQAR